jgi:hypothetical protein
LKEEEVVKIGLSQYCLINHSLDLNVAIL